MKAAVVLVIIRRSKCFVSIHNELVSKPVKKSYPHILLKLE